MARFEQRRWEGSQVAMARRDRRPCDYRVYLPDPLVGRRFSFEGSVAADIADAEAAIRSLNATAAALADTEALARLLLRAESVASSRIEGLEIGGRRILEADAARQFGELPHDVTALEVLRNIDAMVWAVESIRPGSPISLETILEVHRRLLNGTRLEQYAGRLRTDQNWIGGSSFNPCSAVFVPPPPDLVADLLHDLCTFANDESLPAVAQAAIAHAQFETIHPFVDGNGRTGRVLLHLILRRRGLAARVLPPVSLVLATIADDYIAGLTATRYDAAPESDAAQRGMNAWVAIFAGAARRAVADADWFETEVRSLRVAWGARIGKVRRDSAVSLLLDALPAAPILTTTTAAQLLGRSFEAANLAIERLVAAGILRQVNVGRRNRAFEAAELLEAFTSLERRLASPAGNTRVAAPVRRVPRRPN